MIINFIADFFIADIPYGGGERSNNELLNQMANLGHTLFGYHSDKVTPEFLETKKNEVFYVANFLLLREDSKEYLQKNCKYSIIEHDHKYLKNLNPGAFPGFLAPKDQIVNRKFYENAVAVFCQSSLHASVVRQNLGLSNIISLGFNFWDDKDLARLQELSLTREIKHDVVIPDYSDNISKGTAEAIYFCSTNGLKYKLIPKCPPNIFYEKLSEGKKLVFFPRTLETFSRLVIESKIMGLSVVTSKIGGKSLIGACSEEWFGKPGFDYLDFFSNKMPTVKRVLEVMK